MMYNLQNIKERQYEIKHKRIQGDIFTDAAHRARPRDRKNVGKDESKISLNAFILKIYRSVLNSHD